MPHQNPDAAPSSPGELRPCNSCGVVKSEREFPRAPNGRRRVCTSCYVKRNRERITKARASIEEFSAILMWRTRDRARTRGHGAPTISQGWIVQQWDKQEGRCYYSGVPMELGSGPFLVTIERLDVSLGYTTENCVLACLCINMMRGSVPIPEFKWWCSQVAKNDSIEGCTPETEKTV